MPVIHNCCIRVPIICGGRAVLQCHAFGNNAKRLELAPGMQNCTQRVRGSPVEILHLKWVFFVIAPGMQPLLFLIPRTLVCPFDCGKLWLGLAWVENLVGSGT